jgi:hypothetical protein
MNATRLSSLLRGPIPEGVPVKIRSLFKELKTLKHTLLYDQY